MGVTAVDTVAVGYTSWRMESPEQPIGGPSPAEAPEVAAAAGVPFVRRRDTGERVRRAIRTAVVIVVAALGFLLWARTSRVVTGLLLGDASLRPPSAQEHQYAKLAAERGDASLCGRISPQAAVIRPFAGGGHQATLLASGCHFNVAVATRNDRVCSNVRPLGSGWLNGSATTPSNCIAAIRRATYSAQAASHPHSGGQAPGPGLSAAARPAASPGYSAPAGAQAPIAPMAGTGPISPEHALEADHDVQEGAAKEQREKLHSAWDEWKREQALQSGPR